MSEISDPISPEGLAESLRVVHRVRYLSPDRYVGKEAHIVLTPDPLQLEPEEFSLTDDAVAAKAQEIRDSLSGIIGFAVSDQIRGQVKIGNNSLPMRTKQYNEQRFFVDGRLLTYSDALKEFPDILLEDEENEPELIVIARDGRFYYGFESDTMIPTPQQDHPED